VKENWRLFTATAISSIAQEQLVATTGRKNVTPCWNHEERDAIRAKKLVCKAWLGNKAEPSLHLRYAEERTFVA